MPSQKKKLLKKLLLKRPLQRQKQTPMTPRLNLLLLL
jgi:hypothetical protein